MQIISTLVLLLCVLRVDPNEEHMMLCLLNLIRVDFAFKLQCDHLNGRLHHMIHGKLVFAFCAVGQHRPERR